MSPDDPRHGTNAGYLAGCRQQCCRDAAARYQRGLAWDRLRGVERTVPVRGAQRRIEALQALGWSAESLSKQLGYSRAWLNMTVRHNKSGRIYRRNHEKIAALYDELSMRLPPETPCTARQRNYARRMGWAPPLAWDDIDRDAHPCGVEVEEGGMDPAIVARCLAGDFAPAKGLARADRVAIADAWVAAGRSQNELERASGWNVTRDRRLEAAQEVSAA